MLNITLHARERALERFNIKADKVEEKLNSFFKNSVEVFQTNNGRAFRNKQHGIIIVTDQQKQSILTVYQEKGHEIEITDLESLISSHLGSINDVPFRKAIIDNVVTRLEELELQQLELEKEQLKRSAKIVNLRLRAMTTKNDTTFMIVNEEISSLSKLNKEQKKVIDGIKKQSNNIVKDISSIFGVDLTIALNPLRYRKNKIEKALEMEEIENG